MVLRFAAFVTAGMLFFAAEASDPAITVSGLRDPVDKSYRRMVEGAELFEKRRALAPGAQLRFKLLPRKKAASMQDVDVAIVADTFETPLEVASDGTFALPRDARALKENASVRPNRKKQTMTWRADIRTPGLPPGARRLGDLRLECEVGMQAGLISNRPPNLIGWLVEQFGDSPEYCRQAAPRYLFFAERPLWSVTLVSGARRETLSVDRLYGGATRDPRWKETLRYCDCEVLLDRTYFVPLGDPSWPDDTRVELEYMAADPPAGTKADVRAALGQAAELPFDSGFEVWAYRPREARAPWREQVLLFSPSGHLVRNRILAGP